MYRTDDGYFIYIAVNVREQIVWTVDFNIKTTWCYILFIQCLVLVSSGQKYTI